MTGECFWCNCMEFQSGGFVHVWWMEVGLGFAEYRRGKWAEFDRAWRRLGVGG